MIGKTFIGPLSRNFSYNNSAHFFRKLLPTCVIEYNPPIYQKYFSLLSNMEFSIVNFRSDLDFSNHMAAFASKDVDFQL